MKEELSALDLHFLIQEFKILETGRIDKIYQWGKEEFVFRVYTKEGKKHLRISLPSLAFFTNFLRSQFASSPRRFEQLRLSRCGARQHAKTPLRGKPAWARGGGTACA